MNSTHATNITSSSLARKALAVLLAFVLAFSQSTIGLAAETNAQDATKGTEQTEPQAKEAAKEATPAADQPAAQSKAKETPAPSDQSDADVTPAPTTTTPEATTPSNGGTVEDPQDVTDNQPAITKEPAKAPATVPSNQNGSGKTEEPDASTKNEAPAPSKVTIDVSCDNADLVVNGEVVKWAENEVQQIEVDANKDFTFVVQPHKNYIASLVDVTVHRSTEIIDYEESTDDPNTYTIPAKYVTQNMDLVIRGFNSNQGMVNLLGIDDGINDSRYKVKIDLHGESSYVSSGDIYAYVKQGDNRRIVPMKYEDGFLVASFGFLYAGDWKTDEEAKNDPNRGHYEETTLESNSNVEVQLVKWGQTYAISKKNYGHYESANDWPSVSSGTFVGGRYRLTETKGSFSPSSGGMTFSTEVYGSKSDLNTSYITDKMGIAKEFAVFANVFNACSDMEGNIAVNELYPKNANIGNSQSVQSNINKVVVTITKKLVDENGNDVVLSEDAIFKFGIYNRKVSDNGVRYCEKGDESAVKTDPANTENGPYTFDITVPGGSSSASKTVTLVVPDAMSQGNPAAWGVFELDREGNRIVGSDRESTTSPLKNEIVKDVEIDADGDGIISGEESFDVSYESGAYHNGGNSASQTDIQVPSNETITAGLNVSYIGKTSESFSRRENLTFVTTDPSNFGEMGGARDLIVVSSTDFNDVFPDKMSSEKGINAMLDGDLNALSTELATGKTGTNAQVAYIDAAAICDTKRRIQIPYNGNIEASDAQPLVINVVVPENWGDMLSCFNGDSADSIKIGSLETSKSKWQTAEFTPAASKIIWNYVEEQTSDGIKTLVPYTGTVDVLKSSPIGTHLVPQGTIRYGNSTAGAAIAKTVAQVYQGQYSEVCGAEIHKVPFGQTTTYNASVVCTNATSGGTSTDDGKVEVSVRKNWEGEDSAHSIRPDKVTVGLYKGNSEGPFKTQELSEDNNWLYVWNDLEKCEEGSTTPIHYSVKEIAKSEGYTSQVTGGIIQGSDNYSYTVTNTAESTSVGVEKTWVDGEANHANDAIRVGLYKKYDTGLALVEECDLKEVGNWSYTWENLPLYEKKDGDVTPIDYVVREVSIAENDGKSINVTYEGDALSGTAAGYDVACTKNKDTGVFEITNTKHQLQLTKNVVIDDQGKAPSSFKFKLEKVEGESATACTPKDKELSDEGSFGLAAGEIACFNGLASGEYRLTEYVDDAIPEGYEHSFSITDTSSEKNEPYYNETNKTWVYEFKYQAEEGKGLYAALAATNSYKSVKQYGSLTINKTFVDTTNGEEGVALSAGLPETISFTLTAKDDEKFKKDIMLTKQNDGTYKHEPIENLELDKIYVLAETPIAPNELGLTNYASDGVGFVLGNNAPMQVNEAASFEFSISEKVGNTIDVTNRYKNTKTEDEDLTSSVEFNAVKHLYTDKGYEASKAPAFSFKLTALSMSDQGELVARSGDPKTYADSETPVSDDGTTPFVIEGKTGEFSSASDDDSGVTAFDAPVQLGAIEYKEPANSEGEDYYYSIEETPSDQIGGCDPAIYYVRVHVQKNSEGKLEAKKEAFDYRFDKDYPESMGFKSFPAGGSNPLEFYNFDYDMMALFSMRMTDGEAPEQEVQREVWVDPTVHKQLMGAELREGQFSFTLSKLSMSDDGAVAAESPVLTVSNDAYGNVSFGTFDEDRVGAVEGDADPYNFELGYTDADLGMHWYSIRESSVDRSAGITYDGTVFYLGVNVYLDEAGALQADCTYYDAPSADANQIDEDAVVFVNEAEGIDLRVRKQSKDETSDPLLGSTYGLWMANFNGGRDVYLGNATSNEEGWITFANVNLEEGQAYYFKEEAAPEGHLVDSYRSAMFSPIWNGDDVSLVYEDDESFKNRGLGGDGSGDTDQWKDNA